MGDIWYYLFIPVLLLQTKTESTTIKNLGNTLF